MEIMSFEDALLMRAAKFTIQRKAAPGDHVYYNGKLAVLAVDNSLKSVHTLKIIMVEGPFSGRSYKLTGKRIAAIIMVPTVQDLLKQLEGFTVYYSITHFTIKENRKSTYYVEKESLCNKLAALWRHTQPPLTIKKIQA